LIDSTTVIYVRFWLRIMFFMVLVVLKAIFTFDYFRSFVIVLTFLCEYVNRTNFSWD
jgi:hypothetical protein